MLFLSDGVKISFDKEDPAVKDGESLLLRCITDANPEIESVHWQKVGNSSFKQNGHLLNLTHVNIDDAGAYRCHATNRLTPTDSQSYSYASFETIDVNVLCELRFLGLSILLGIIFSCIYYG